MVKDIKIKMLQKYYQKRWLKLRAFTQNAESKKMEENLLTRDIISSRMINGVFRHSVLLCNLLPMKIGQ